MKSIAVNTAKDFATNPQAFDAGMPIGAMNAAAKAVTSVPQMAATAPLVGSTLLAESFNLLGNKPESAYWDFANSTDPDPLGTAILTAPNNAREKLFNRTLDVMSGGSPEVRQSLGSGASVGAAGFNVGLLAASVVAPALSVGDLFTAAPVISTIEGTGSAGLGAIDVASDASFGFRSLSAASINDPIFTDNPLILDAVEIEQRGLTVFSPDDVSLGNGAGTSFPTAPGGTGAAYNEATGQGVYILRNPEMSGRIEYVGRGDAPTRLAAHAIPGSGKEDLVGQILFNNNLAAEQAQSLEHNLMHMFGGPQSVNPSSPLRNIIQGVGENNSNFLQLESAARDELVFEALRRAGQLD